MDTLIRCIQTSAYFDSINRPRDLIKTAADLGLCGIALTDHETVAGHIDFLNSEKELKEAGLIPQDFKCACGNEIYLVDDRENIERYWHYILIAKNTEGHKALRELSSIAWYNGFSSRGMMRVPTEKKELEMIVKKYPNTIIASSACLGSELDHFVVELCKEERKKIPDENLIYQWKSKIDKWIRWNIDLFGDDFYLELQAGTSKDQIMFNERIWSIAAAYNVKLILTSDAHYLTTKERPVHKAYLNSKDGEREVDEFYESAHLMTNEEAFANLEKAGYFKEQFNIICNNTMDIYNKIENYELGHKPIIPEVQVTNYPKKEVQLDIAPTLTQLFKSDNIQERAWINMCWDSMIEKRLDQKENYVKRLEIEADIISSLSKKIGDCLYKYFNTFQHYIDLFWACDSMVGPGRGSSGAFLSNYLLGITQADPIKFGFPEWRFLNKEKVELPDIDIDLTPSRRQMIFDAIRKERGELNLVQVCTYGTEGTRSAIAAACRGYRSEEYPEGIDVDTSQYLSSLIPQERGFLWPIKDAIEGNEEKGRKPIQALINELDKYPGLLEIIQSIEGLKRKLALKHLFH